MGESISQGYAWETNTRRPGRIRVLPIGGLKGSGLAIMMDMFGGLLTSAASEGDVVDINKDMKTP